MRSWKVSKMEMLTGLYGAAAARYEEEKAGDDRMIYVRTYKELLEALRSLPNEPHPMVRLAMNRLIGDECGMMDRIRERFERKG